MAKEMKVSEAYRFMHSPNKKTARRALAIIRANKRKKQAR